MKLKNLILIAFTAAMAICVSSCSETNSDSNASVVIGDAISYEIISSSTSDFTVDVTVADGAEVGNYVVGLIGIDDYINDDAIFSSLIISEIESMGGDLTVVDNKYVFNSSATIDLNSAWDISAGESVVGIFSVNASGELNSEILSAKVTVIGNSLSIEVLSVGDVTCSVKVTKNASSIDRYYVAVGTTAILNDSYAGDTEAYAAQFISDELNVYGTDLSYVDEMYVFSANSIIALNNSWILTSATEHIVLAFGIESDGTISSDVASVTFQTNVLEMSDNTFTFKVEDITSSGAYIQVTPTNDDTYYFDAIETAYFDYYSDEEVISLIISSAGVYLSDFLSSGWDAYDFTGYLSSNTYYTPIAFGTNGSAGTTALFKGDVFYTEDDSDDSSSILPTEIVIPDVDFGTIELVTNDSGSFTMTVTPNDKEMDYIAFVAYSQYFATFDCYEDIILDDLAYMQATSEYYGGDIYEDWDSWTKRGDVSGDISGFEAGYDCVGYAYGIDKETLQPLTNVATVTCTYPSSAPAKSASVSNNELATKIVRTSLPAATRNGYRPLVLLESANLPKSTLR